MKLRTEQIKVLNNYPLPEAGKDMMKPKIDQLLCGRHQGSCVT
jgi:hypothetical protein